RRPARPAGPAGLRAGLDPGRAGRGGHHQPRRLAVVPVLRRRPGDGLRDGASRRPPDVRALLPRHAGPRGVPSAVRLRGLVPVDGPRRGGGNPDPGVRGRRYFEMVMNSVTKIAMITSPKMMNCTLPDSISPAASI